jgi:hypothetical protein
LVVVVVVASWHAECADYVDDYVKIKVGDYNKRDVAKDRCQIKE